MDTNDALNQKKQELNNIYPSGLPSDRQPNWKDRFIQTISPDAFQSRQSPIQLGEDWKSDLVNHMKTAQLDEASPEMATMDDSSLETEMIQRTMMESEINLDDNAETVRMLNVIADGLEQRGTDVFQLREFIKTLGVV